MLVQTLKRLEPFRQLRWPELVTVARHSQVLSLPASRWLLRRGRRLPGRYYLLRGRVQLWHPERELDARTGAALQAFYPGAVAVRTASATQVLHVDTQPIEFLWQSVAGKLGDRVVFSSPQERWVERFLASPLLQRLQPQQWQRLLSQGRTLVVRAHQVVIHAGHPGENFYVLKTGRAVVQRHGRIVAFLSPGDFFGEDALVTGSPRNANVTMSVDGELLVLERDDFLRSLLMEVLRGLQHKGFVGGQRPTLLWIGDSAPTCAGAVCMPLGGFREAVGQLNFRRRYAVAGGSDAERALAVLLLAQSGIDVGLAPDSP